MRRFGFQSWDDGTRLYRASRGPAILPHPLLRLEPCRCWCGAGANQPNPTHRTHSPSPAPPRLNRPFLLLLLLLRFPLPPSSPSLPPSPTARPRPHPLPSPPPFTTATATTTAAAAVTPLPPLACHPLLPTAVLYFHLMLHVLLPSSFGLPNYYTSSPPLLSHTQHPLK